MRLTRIMVTFAVLPESAPLRRLRNFRRITGTNTPVYVSRIGETEVYAVTTGIGARGIHADVRQLLAESDLVIVSGLAGSLKHRHGVRTILMAKAIKGDNSKTPISIDECLVKTATECGATAVDFFYTAELVVNSASKKLQLGESADAVEMESFHLITEAQRHGVPGVAVRAVSDPVDHDLPLDFNQLIDEHGEIGWRPALSEIAAAPLSIPRLVRFGFQSSRGARQLGKFLDKYLNSLCAGATLHQKAELFKIEKARM